MSDYYQQLAGKIQARLGDQVACKVAMGEATIEIAAAKDLLVVARVLRDEDAFGFDQLLDLCGVDYSAYGNSPWGGKRFAVVYHLLSVANNHRLRVRVYADDDALPMIDSVLSIWASANWFEREAFDLFGIVFNGHPDLRRILTDYGFIGHPFRKDFPVSGNVEMRYDPEKRRVTYEPVSIDPRDLIPRVFRDDHRYLDLDTDRKTQDA